MAETRRAVALELSEDLLGDFELSRLGPTELVRKASRLARMLDDHDALTWLGFEVAGYPKDADGLPADAWEACKRSGRRYEDKEGTERAFAASVGELAAYVEAAKAQIAAATDAAVNVVSANPNQFVSVPTGNAHERSAARNLVGEQQGRLDRVLGSVHRYVTARNYELRFGAAVESAFEQVRQVVDGEIASLVPQAVGKLAAAFENAASDNPEHWANAASTCRRLIKAVADELRPPGPDVNGRKMGPDNYINRLVDWINGTDPSGTAGRVTTTELAHFGERLDAADNAGHKGAHTEVTKFDASRFITGTYLLLGDILRLNSLTDRAVAVPVPD